MRCLLLLKSNVLMSFGSVINLFLKNILTFFVHERITGVYIFTHFLQSLSNLNFDINIITKSKFCTLSLRDNWKYCNLFNINLIIPLNY